MILDPINDPDNEDFDEVACCHWCHACIEPGHEAYVNGWAWHERCKPLELEAGREQEARDAEAQGK